MHTCFALAGDDPDNYSVALPTLYNVTYYLPADNFLGDGDTAQDTYTAQSYMFLDVLTTTSNVTFNSMGLNYSQISVAVGASPGRCLCGASRNCPTMNCSEVLVPSG